MADLTRDEILKAVREGRGLQRADLRGVDLSRAALEGVDLRRADLEGANLEGAKLAKANLTNASLREAFLAGADLAGANLDKVDLEGANLERAVLTGANLSHTNLEGAKLTGAKLAGAKLTGAQLDSANLAGADLTGASLAHADLSDAQLGGARAAEADLSDAELVRADFSGADLRRATLARARVEGAAFTGARVAGLTGTGVATGVNAFAAAWLDISAGGDGAQRTAGPHAAALITGVPYVPAASAAGGTDAAGRRFFGKGDVLRNATLEFGDGARVEIQSRFERCSIALGEGTELVIGSDGVLDECQISGSGNITVHGRFFERESPGIVGARELVVSAAGAVVAAVEQPATFTRFAFEPGCRLRVRILQSRAASNGGRQ